NLHLRQVAGYDRVGRCPLKGENGWNKITGTDLTVGHTDRERTDLRVHWSEIAPLNDGIATRKAGRVRRGDHGVPAIRGHQEWLRAECKRPVRDAGEVLVQVGDCRRRLRGTAAGP